jgi:hypothetical protein
LTDTPAPAAADTANTETNAAAAAATAGTDKPGTENANAGASWRDGIPEDIRNDPNFAKYDTAEGLYRGHLSLVKMLGAEKVAIPKEGDAASLAAWDKAAGVPEKIEDYGFKPPEGLPQGLQYVPELDQRIATALMKAGVSKSRAGLVRDEVLNIAMEVEKAKLDQAEAAKETGVAQLRQEYGRAFDQKLRVAKAAVKEYGGDEFVAFLDQSGLGDHPAMVRAFSKIAERTMGDTQLVNGEGDPGALTPADLDKQIAEHAAKYRAALFDKTHPEHNLRVKERDALFNKRFPAKASA